jgi:hypothetical protein
MKQYCTVEQITSLSPEAQQRLREWWKPQEGDMVYVVDSFAHRCVSYDEQLIEGLQLGAFSYRKEDCLPLLSIGQCIELLAEKGWLCIEHYEPPREDKFVFAVCTNMHSVHEEPDLIDALFAAVKVVLEVQP